MALGFSSYQRLERFLLKTRNILGEGTDDTFKENNKAQALQRAAALYGWYSGDGSETTYTDDSSVGVLQSELIAITAAITLLISAISYYKDQVVSGSGGPASFAFRSDKLDWLKEQIELLKGEREELESSLGLTDSGTIPGLALTKVRACADPVDDVCCDDESSFTNWYKTI